MARRQTPYGTSAGGRPRVWTGKVASWEQVNQMTHWDKHGSTGKQWNGITRQWEKQDESPVEKAHTG